MQTENGICQDVIKSETAWYEEKVVEALVKELSGQYGNGYGKRNLFRRIKLYEAFGDYKIVTTMSPQLTWSHLVQLISIEDILKI